MSKHASEGDFAELALTVYVEELVAHKRVLFVGDPSSPAPERLAGSARSVDVVSARSRVRGTRRGGRVASRRWPGAEDEGRWEVVIVPDVGAAGLADPDRVAELARWVARGGVVVAGSPDRELAGGNALGYEQLFDLLHGTFEHVRMLGQAPFVGFSVVDFAPPGELEVTFDGSILEGAGERAERYYALCGDRDVVLDAYAVVQVPSRALAEAEASARGREEHRASELAARLREQQDALDAVNVHAEEIERELEAVRGELERARQDVARARADASSVEHQRASLEGRIRELEGELAALAQAQDAGQEYAALEGALYERGREIGELRLEVERRGTLVRDLVEELRELERAGGAVALAVAPTVPPTSDDAHLQLRSLHAQLDQAMARAVESEAEKAELGFRLDEVRGELAMAERRFEQELEEMRRLEAALRGTVRGLNARLGEVIELHQLTQARLALVEDDRAAADARNRRLVRELAEAREQLELEIARACTTENEREDEAPIEGGDAAREGRLLGELARAREEAAELEAWQGQARGELEKARTALSELDQQVRSIRASYEARVAELVEQLHQASAQGEQALTELGGLRAHAAAHDALEAELRGELAGLRLRLADREQAVQNLRGLLATAERPAAEITTAPGESVEAPPEVPRTPDEPAHPVELEELRRELAGLRTELETLTAARQRAEQALEAERGRADAAVSDLDEARGRLRALEGASPAGAEGRVRELTERVQERDAVVARLERELADLATRVEERDAVMVRLEQELAEAAERRAGLEQRIEESAAQLARAREDIETARAAAAVDAEETHRELDEVRDRLDHVEVERDRALSALGDARAILHQLMGELPARSDGAPVGESVVLRQLRERIARLDAEASDRDVLLRSLTAQLEERDDRIRALERLDDGQPTEDSRALQQKVLEMEERVARLQEELEHERARRRLEHPS